MPSIRCPNCGKRIDDQTPVCPYCGHGLHDNFFKVVLPSYDELGDKALSVAKYIATLRKIEVNEAIALLKKGRIVIKKNASFEQAQRISQNFAKSGIKVIVVDARPQTSESRKSPQKRKSNKLPFVLTSIFLILIVGTVGTISIYHHYFMNSPENMVMKETLQNNSSDEATPFEITIPDISNISASVAEQILINSGLVPVIEEINDDNITVGNVVKCEPASGNIVKVNSRVIVYVSKDSLYEDILSQLESGNYDRADELLLSAQFGEYIWADHLSQQATYERYAYSTIANIIEGLDYPDSFRLISVTFHKYFYEERGYEYIDIEGDGLLYEDVVRYPACVIEYEQANDVGETSVWYAYGCLHPQTQTFYSKGSCSTLRYGAELPSSESWIKELILDLSDDAVVVGNFDIERLKNIFNHNDIVSALEINDSIPYPSASDFESKDFHVCDDGNCTNEGSEKYLALYGEYEYYCPEHFEKMLQTAENLESRTELGILGEHTCEKCETVGMHSIIGMSGEVEYYCTKHYRDIRKTLNVDAEETLEQLKINHAVDKISEIGEVTLNSEAAILAAQEAFDLLSESEAEQVHNYHILEEATSQLKNLREAQLDKDIANAVSKFNVSTDKVSGRTIYKSPAEPYYADTRCFVLPQLVVLEEEGFVGMRLTFHYTNDSWLFFDKVTIYVDGEKYYVNFDYGEVNRDNDSGDIWEWAVIIPTFAQKEMLQNIADSSETIVRFHGDPYYDDFTMNDSDKQAIRDFLVADELFSQKYTDLSSYVSTSP